MSYVVDVTDIPDWLQNSWSDVYDRYLEGGEIGPFPCWSSTYGYVYELVDNAVLYGNRTVTFPDEQSYIWFVLKWS